MQEEQAKTTFQWLSMPRGWMTMRPGVRERSGGARKKELVENAKNEHEHFTMVL